MPYLYGVSEISLSAVRDRLLTLRSTGLSEEAIGRLGWEGDDDERTFDQVAIEWIIDETGKMSMSSLSELLDWHQLEDLFYQFEEAAYRGLIHEDDSAALAGMLGGGVLGIEPIDWGYVGSTTSEGLSRLRSTLEASPQIVARADHATAVELANVCPRLGDPNDPLAGPGRILASIRSIPPGCDIAVNLS